jgi:CheY-like chemotaxis protein
MFGRTKKEIVIQELYERKIWPVEADRGQIEQVLLNLYVNAFHAMPAGGSLLLATENVSFGNSSERPFNLPLGNYVKLSVTDTGVGMDEKTQQRIFEPFFTTRAMGRGTGLGLASVYGIIKNHKGIIEVISKIGAGTTFIIYLPAAEREVKNIETASDSIFKGIESVLLVDDEDQILDVERDILSSLGYTVLVATNGKQAIKLYETNHDKIDIVLLDMIMPGMGGGEIYDALRKIKSDVKVLLCSGYSEGGQAAEILQRGCAGFIQKPFNVSELSEKLREIIDKSG